MRLFLVLALSLFSVSASANWTSEGTYASEASCRSTGQWAVNSNDSAYRTVIAYRCVGNDNRVLNYWRSTSGPVCSEGTWNQQTYQCDAPPDPDDIGPEDCVERGMAIEGASIWSRSEGCKTRPVQLPPLESECTQGDNFCTSKMPDVNDGEWNCGMFNGVETCVQSSSTGSDTGIGTGTKPVGTSSSIDPNKTITETKTSTSSDGTKTTTTTTTKTTETTTTTEPNPNGGGAPLGTGQSLDAGTGPAAPYVCSDGRLAANMLSCDSDKSCPAGQYLAYGVCLALPTVTTVTDKTTTTIETTVTDNVTGETETSTETSEETKAGEKEECDPAREYCGGGFGEFDLYQPDDEKTYQSVISAFKDRITASAVVSDVNTFFSFDRAGSCPSWSADIGMGFAPITFDFFCRDLIPWSIISAILFASSLFFAVRIALT